MELELARVERKAGPKRLVVAGGHQESEGADMDQLRVSSTWATIGMRVPVCVNEH